LGEGHAETSDGVGTRVGLDAGPAHAASELSVTNRLDDRRAVAAGTRAYSIGFEDGRFYANGWPEGLGNVEREGMGEEKLDNTVYLIRGLNDFADMARAKRDRANESWARGVADRMRARLDATWWLGTQYPDSLKAGAPIQQRHWIGVTPMDAELTIGGRVTPGLAPAEHATAALGERRQGCFSGTAPFNLGLFHTGCQGGPAGKGERTIFSLTLDDHGHDRRNRRARGPSRGHDAAGRRGDRDGDARRRAREQADGARDQPRRRGDRQGADHRPARGRGD
jgi:hypothetical protein